MGEILGARGAFPGVVTQQGDSVQVTGRPPQGLQVGDQIEAILAGQKSLPIDTARKVYDEFSFAKPGDSVNLQIRRQGQVQRVAVRATQMIDDQSPLFSLFVRRGNNQLEWIGWTPVSYTHLTLPTSG